MENKKILFIVTSLAEGGAGKMVHHIASVFANEYKHVYAVAINKEEKIALNNGVTYISPLNEHRGGINGFYHTIKAIRKLVKDINPNIVISFVSDVAVCTRIATLGIRNIIVLSAERGDPFTLNGMWKLLTQWAYVNSDACFFQLPDARDFFGKRIKKKSYVIPNAAFFNGEIGSHAYKNKTIVSAGRFVWEKGFECLIDAFAVIHKEYPEYKLVLYGDGPFKQKYEEQIDKLHLAEFVVFPGYTRDISGALKNEGIFVLPSRYEGIPNVLIEALLVGIPTISCDCTPGGPRFLTNNGERGIIVPVDDVERIVDSIKLLLNDRRLYKEYEEKGPTIINELSPEIVEKQWKEAFVQIESR